MGLVQYITNKPPNTKPFPDIKHNIIDINIHKIRNYLALIKSIKIPINTEDDLLIYKRVLDYNNSFRLIVSTFDSTYAILQAQLSPIAAFAKENKELIGITQNIMSRISTCSN